MYDSITFLEDAFHRIKCIKNLLMRHDNDVTYCKYNTIIIKYIKMAVT